MREGASELELPAPIIGHPLTDSARALGLSRRGLRRAIARCAVRTVAIGRVKIIPPAELQRLAKAMGRLRFRPGTRERDPMTGRFRKGAPP
jgi:hypothetical protein